MRCVPLRPVGGEVTGLSLRTVDPKEVAELEELLADRGVLILPGQHLDDAEFVRLLARFGRLTFTPGETAVAGLSLSDSLCKRRSAYLCMGEY
jgi:taurine dioxygenase